MGGDIPHRVPGVVLLAIVVHGVVALHTRRVHGELEARAPIVVGIDHDLELIGRSPDIPAREELQNAVGMWIEGANKDIEVAVVVGDLSLRGKARIAVFPGLELTELRDGRRHPPDLVVVPPVDHHRDLRPNGDRARWTRCGGRLNGAATRSRRGGLEGEREQEDSRHDGSPVAWSDG